MIELTLEQQIGFETKNSGFIIQNPNLYTIATLALLLLICYTTYSTTVSLKELQCHYKTTDNKTVLQITKQCN